MSLFDTGIRPAVDNYLLAKSKEERNYGNYWSASSAGNCMRKVIFERLGVPHVESDSDARKQRVFEAGHVFHQWAQQLTKDAGISIAQELELEDTSLMIRGHIDDLVLINDMKPGEVIPFNGKHGGDGEQKAINERQLLILYDYKSQNSRAFTYQKGKPMSYYHSQQLATYMYMLKKLAKEELEKRKK